MRFDKLGYSEDSNPENVQLWLRTLSCLPSLDRIEVGDYGYPNSLILETMHQHSTVSSIIFENLRQVPRDIQLAEMSKITIKSCQFRQSDFSKTAVSYLLRGMVVNELVIPASNRFEDYLFTAIKAVDVFSRLRAVTFGTCNEDTDSDLSQLFRLAPYCLSLEIIQFFGTGGHLHGVPSISIFFEKLLRIDQRGRISKVRTTLKRQSAVTPSGSLWLWLVTGMLIYIQYSLEDILSLIQELFPTIEQLELRFCGGKMYHVVSYVYAQL